MTLNACVSPAPYPQEFGFEHNPGTLVSYVEPEFEQTDLDSQMRLKQCFPLYTILLACDLTTLDLLTLDVEGIESLVLHTVPWNRVDIKIVMVEYVQPGVQNDDGSFNPIYEQPITNLMVENGYLLVHRLETDLIFVKNGSEYARAITS
ncbi:protein Star-like [Pollicipes pollicipes]|uniref:protein Star-like n=1 Tax=Pollicipes pollicipes TaxID=41117 RepID=UPI0018849408|nr:protein Star-like [Pollicipes pollicipes]